MDNIPSHRVSAAVLLGVGVRSLPRYGNAFGSNFGVPMAKVGSSLDWCLLSYGELKHCHSKTWTKWFYSTRLETRTKESTSIASVRVANLYAQ